MPTRPKKKAKSKTRSASNGRGARAQDLGHGDRAQDSGHGSQEYLGLLPGCATPGFDWITPRAIHIWLGLFHHARKQGQWIDPQFTFGNSEDNASNDIANQPELGALWTVDLLAKSCGISRNTAGAALKAPHILTTAAKNRYKEKIDAKKQELQQLEEKMRRVAPDYKPEEEEDETKAAVEKAATKLLMPSAPRNPNSNPRRRRRQG